MGLPVKFSTVQSPVFWRPPLELKRQELRKQTERKGLKAVWGYSHSRKTVEESVPPSFSLLSIKLSYQMTLIIKAMASY